MSFYHFLGAVQYSPFSAYAIACPRVYTEANQYLQQAVQDTAGNSDFPFLEATQFTGSCYPVLQRPCMANFPNGQDTNHIWQFLQASYTHQDLPISPSITCQVRLRFGSGRLIWRLASDQNWLVLGSEKCRKIGTYSYTTIDDDDSNGAYNEDDLSVHSSDEDVGGDQLIDEDDSEMALKDACKGKNKDAREEKELSLQLRSEVGQVWAVAAQLHNEVKKKAKTVVEHAYGLNIHSKQWCVALATWLLKTHPMRVNGVKHDIPNFVFGDMELLWNKDRLDTKKCRVSPEQLFRHPVISKIIVQQWFVGNGGASQAVHRFREVPDNLICLVCNSIELGLKEAISSTQIMFTNRQFAPKWDSLMTILEAMQENTPDYYHDLKTYIWGRISQRVDSITSNQSDDEPDENFMDWTTLQQAAKPASPSRPASGPSTLRPTTAKLSSVKLSSSRAAAKSARTTEQEKDSEVDELQA
ncbi:uncharacterized protein B0H18DRAFT_950986 [Fomitopsis serialis]|uniref:uncharacterized protein n=1 Tax=Fomitopsis serialis TaxID=139415 RepID=UPI0020085F2B|nr:uncharacterized protein B0H18DRAFT_950986 [Neoantrodia serialis]KAH9935434.1 hypothetical protein B0H18DRAFT_950986 [Neoantrodia serialis]